MYDIPIQAKKILEIISEAGFEDYLVGGCVRDLLLGREPDDWDITTSGLPEQIENIFNNISGYRTEATGKKHGTITVICYLEEGTVCYEITTYRVDGGYSDGRHPDKVFFTRNLEEDLRRRDFTINAIAMDGSGKLNDPLGGKIDIDNKIIKAASNPAARFSEDALRILRGVRFEAQLKEFGFTMDEATMHAMLVEKEKLVMISAERIQVELNKILLSSGASFVLRKYRDIIALIIPELAEGFDFDQQNPYHCYDVYEHILHAIDGIEHIEDEQAYLTVKLAALLHDIGKPRCFLVKDGRGHFYGHEKVSAKMAKDILKRLKYSRRITEDVIFLVEKHGSVFTATEKFAKRKLNQMGEGRLRMLIALERGDVSAQTVSLPDTGEEIRYARIDNINEFENCVQSVIDKSGCFSLDSLAINGKDLIKAGIEEGPEVGRILKEILEKVIDGKLENERGVLLREVKRILKEYPLYS